jgi:hypothetical protein
MPSNRHRRRKDAARVRRNQPAGAGSQSPGARIVLGSAGLLLIGLALFLLLEPRTARSMRGPMFALVLGGALLASAFIPSRR